MAGFVVGLRVGIYWDCGRFGVTVVGVWRWCGLKGGCCVEVWLTK